MFPLRDMPPLKTLDLREGETLIHFLGLYGERVGFKFVGRTVDDMNERHWMALMADEMSE